MLTGLYEPTKGTAVIAGFDITTNINDIHRHLGVCPQFDIQHADLTAEEHLLFYARLKGVKWSRERAVVEKALRQVSGILINFDHFMYGVPLCDHVCRYIIVYVDVILMYVHAYSIVYMYSRAYRLISMKLVNASQRHCLVV